MALSLAAMLGDSGPLIVILSIVATKSIFMITPNERQRTESLKEEKKVLINMFYEGKNKINKKL